MMEAGNESTDEQHRGSIMGHLGSLFQQNKSNAAFAQFSGAATYGHAAAAHSDTRSLGATKAEDAEEAAQRSQSHRESGVSNTLRMFERGMSAQVLDVRWDRRGGQREKSRGVVVRSPPFLPPSRSATEYVPRHGRSWTTLSRPPTKQSRSLLCLLLKYTKTRAHSLHSPATDTQHFLLSRGDAVCVWRGGGRECV